MKGLNDVELPELVQNLSNLEWITHRSRNRSVIDDLFTLQCIELRMCSMCSKTSVNVQSMNILSLPIPNKPGAVELSDCLSTFIAQERLGGCDGLQCSRCQVEEQVPQTPGVSRVQSQPLSPIQPHAESLTLRSSSQFLSSTPLPGSSLNRQSVSAALSTGVSTKVLTEGVRQCLLRRLPECLTIQLLRFSYDTSTKKIYKICTSVAVPLQHVDLSSVTYDSTVDRDDVTIISKSHVYSLYALSLHMGGENSSSGHYLAYCRGVDGCWYKFDDEEVVVVRNIELELKSANVRKNCYLLFYRKDHVG